MIAASLITSFQPPLGYGCVVCAFYLIMCLYRQ